MILIYLYYRYYLLINIFFIKIRTKEKHIRLQSFYTWIIFIKLVSKCKSKYIKYILINFNNFL